MEESLYEILMERKKNGEKLDWENIKKEDLEELFKKASDSMIAELYGVSKSKVTYKRKKWDIKIRNYSIQEFWNDNSNREVLNMLNKNAKERLLDEKNFDVISIALTHYLFRNGPVEDMHSDGKLSQKDMKTLNKFMVNRISGLLKTMNKEEWLKLELLFNFYSLFGNDWDKPEPDTTEIDMIYSKSFE